MKRSHYETFWNTHHFFVLFFTALLFHGSVWWMWAALPLGLYVFDRVVVRILLRGRTPIALARVYFWGARKKDGKVKTPDVITLQFVNAVDDKGVKPVEYMEGTRSDASQTGRIMRAQHPHISPPAAFPPQATTSTSSAPPSPSTPSGTRSRSRPRPTRRSSR